MRCEGPHDLGDVEVDLVAEGGETREAEVVVSGELFELESEVATLGDDAYRSVCQADEVESGGGVEHTHAVGSDEHGPRFPHPLEHLLLPPGTLRPELAQAGGEHDDRPSADVQGVSDHDLEGVGVDGDDDEVGSLGKVVQRADGPSSEHDIAAAIDEVDASAVLARQRSGGQAVSPLGRVVRGADDRHRPRIEQGAQVAPCRVAAAAHPRSDHAAVYSSAPRRLSPLATMTRWISLVPSQIRSTRTSRK